MIRTSIISLLLAAVWCRAEPADLVVRAHYVVTMDASRRVIENGAVAVRGSRIAAVGPRAEIEKRFQPKTVLDRPDAILTPGLISTHTHAPMSLLRGVADDLRLQEWLEKYIFPAEAKNVDAEFVRWGARLACLEMLLSGTTTFTDMYYFEEVIGEVAREAGMRGVLGETIIGFPAPDAKTPALALERTEAFLRRFRNDPLVTPAVAPHALYTNSDATLKACRALANRYDVPLLTHLSETRRENEDTLAARGTSPARVLDALGIFEGRTLCAHGVWLDDDDLQVLKAKNVGLAHCPSSNMKLASGVAPVTKILSLGIAMGLGPDGPAGSNNDFNLFEEMDLAAKLQKVITGDPRALPAKQVFEMATITGATALGMEKDIGSIEQGKLADLTVVALGAPHSVPLYNVYSQLVYALKGSDVSDVVVNGKLVVKDRRPLTLDAQQIRAKASDYALRVRTSLSVTQ